MIARLLLTLAALWLPAEAYAETRGFSVTSFNRIQVNGPFTVIVTTGRGSSARAEGDARAIDQLAVSVTGRTLRVRRNTSNSWGGFPGDTNVGRAILRLSTHEIEQATVTGAGDLTIDRMDGGRLIASLGGDGRLAIGTIEADSLSLNVAGSGIMEASGTAETGRVTIQGAGNLEATELMIETLRLDLSGPGTARIAAGRSATVTSSGSGNVTVYGDPACTVQRLGSGDVICGATVN